MARPGFVSLEPTGLTLDGQSFRHVGVNLPGLAYYGDGPLPAAAIDKDVNMDAARCMGAKGLRIFASHNRLDTNLAVARLRDLADRALGIYDLRLIVSFTDMHPNYHHPPGDDRFYTGPGGILNKDWFINGFSENYWPWVRQVVTALRDHPGVWAWEIGNELRVSDDTQLFVDFMRVVSTGIKALDPDHLVTSGLGVTRAQPTNLTTPQTLLLYEPAIDIVQVHKYNGEIANNDLDIAAALGRAHIVGEAGYAANREAGLVADLYTWLQNLGSDGYYQWGFMATAYDNGDGDSVYGMDRVLHGDWDALYRVYQGWTQFTCEPIPPPPPPPPPPPIPPPGVIQIPFAVLLAGGAVLGAGLYLLLGELTKGVPEREVVVSDVREIEAGEPIPPGYEVVG